MPSLKQLLERYVSPESLEFLRHSRNYLSASAISQLFSVAIIPVLTALLTPAEYGILRLYTTLVTLFTIVCMLNFKSSVSRYYLEGFDDFDRALGSMMLFLFAFNGALITAVAFFADPLARFCAVDTEVFLYAVGTALAVIWLEIYLSYLATAQQSRAHSVLSVFRNTVKLSLGVVLILLLEERRYLGAIWGELAVLVLLGAYGLYALNKLASYEFGWGYVRYAARFSLPLLPHSMSRFILGYFDRIIIQQLVGARATGLYSFAYDVGMAMSMIVVATGQAWKPIFFEQFRDANLARINRMARGYANQIYLAAIAIMLFAADVVELIIDADYHEGVRLIPAIVLGYVFVFLYTLFFQYSAFRKRTELISLNTFIAGAANIGLNYLFIPKYGYAAAAWTTLASFALLFALHYANARFVLKEQVIPLRILLPNFVWVAAVAALLMGVPWLLESTWTSFGLRLPLMGVAAWYFLVWCKRRTAAD